MTPGANVTAPPLVLVWPVCWMVSVVPSNVQVPVPQTRLWGQVSIVPTYPGERQLTMDVVLSARKSNEITPPAVACEPLVKSTDCRSQIPTTEVGVGAVPPLLPQPAATKSTANTMSMSDRRTPKNLSPRSHRVNTSSEVSARASRKICCQRTPDRR